MTFQLHWSPLPASTRFWNCRDLTRLSRRWEGECVSSGADTVFRYSDQLHTLWSFSNRLLLLESPATIPLTCTNKNLNNNKIHANWQEPKGWLLASGLGLVPWMILWLYRLPWPLYLHSSFLPWYYHSILFLLSLTWFAKCHMLFSIFILACASLIKGLKYFVE